MSVSVLVIDNQDSFTLNIVEALRAAGARVRVQENTESVDLAGIEAVVISPGPGHPGIPGDVGSSVTALHSGLPVLGVCLGHQLMAQECGGVVAQVNPAHGIISEVHHDDSELFRGLASPFAAVRYHSLAVIEVPGELEVTARTEEGLVMGLRHREKPWWGVQFHPESIGAPGAERVLHNFVAMVRRRRQALRVHHRHLEGCDLDAVGVYRRLYAREEYALWLDDSTGRGYSFLTAPREHAPQGAAGAEVRVPPLPFAPMLGWVGYLTYPRGEHFRFADSAVVVGPTGVHLLALDAAWLDHAERALAASPIDVPPPAPRPTLRCADTREEYLDKIARLQRAIAAGETYEACLTTQLRGTSPGLGLADYLALREANPTLYGAYLRWGGVQIMSTSPETFVRVRGGVVESRPIKGTRPRGATGAEDAALREDLAHNPKDRAENLMVVDLVRHDLTRVARPGTVRAEPLFEVETYATAHQLVSTVRAELAASPWELIRAAFPGGSMTGAPKKRTMEILADLEGRERGVYSGAIGYIGLDGTVDLSMTIRTLVEEDGELSYGVGGAILAASNPEAEYQEIITKARPLRAIAEVEFP
ncbi:MULTISPECIES: aminodeoxychorismate synthase component I [unclassified Corynebacterium]|uniref:aminodeoxychorismate synthase component I n=1 Tax=unclassified Corynebacterium TaxID=2624378 RepID=UPI0029C9BD87|nr:MULTISPECIES: aminodeoxychorismate synthase component I [unclassified Corynebacterium]WPF65785.1 aminodeoxychorismate synthase component I [Corynebacterium sp. 22KM0430]WPF68279.1 aminodeoxychorismate synthase component I [Corynebacterium sp. 21KM1197]